MKIVHLGKYYPPAAGGIETHVQTLARVQASLGADVRVVCVNHLDSAGRDITFNTYATSQRKNDLDRVDARAAVRVIRLGRNASFKRLDVVPGLPKMLEDLQEEQVDVIHLHTPNPTMLFAAASLRIEVPLVITHHSDIIKQKILRYAMRPFERCVYGRSSLVLSSSDEYAKGSATLCAYRSKVESLPLGLDLERYLKSSDGVDSRAAAIRKEHGDVIWLGVGRCVYYKGFDTAVSALRDVPGKLIIVGSGPLKEQLAAQARLQGVEDRLVWWGRASEEDLAALYRAATAFWFPSNARSEAFGLVQVEAMASGCPVINTRIEGSGVAWVSRHEETGLTVPVNSPTEFASAARRMVEEPGLRERLSRGAVERATREFDATMMGRRSLEAYERALQRYRKRTQAAEPAVASLGAWVRKMAEIARL